MARQANWEARLAELETELAGRRWRWGRHDCLAVTRAAVEAVTGIAPKTPVVRSMRAYDRIAQDLRAILATICRDLGFEPIDPLYAQRGDVVLLAGDALGWISTSGFPVTAGKRGLDRVQWAGVLRAWRV